jgi:hypothetical protein
MPAKHRKKGDWVAVAKGRANRDRDLSHHSGHTGIPKSGEVGSAAYRRLLAKGTRRG